jgi:hypothetical protein
VESELWKVEEEFWRGDAGYYEEALAPHATMVLPAPAGIMDRVNTVQAIRNAPRWQSVEFRDRRSLSAAGQTRILVYRVLAKRSQDQASYEALCSSVYIQVKNTWQLLLHQQTPLEAH